MDPDGDAVTSNLGLHCLMIGTFILDETKEKKISGPSCSKLTMSLVNASLRFQNVISNICQYFLLRECVGGFCSAEASLIFSTRDFGVLGYIVAKHLMS